MKKIYQLDVFHCIVGYQFLSLGSCIMLSNTCHSVKHLAIWLTFFKLFSIFLLAFKIASFQQKSITQCTLRKPLSQGMKKFPVAGSGRYVRHPNTKVVSVLNNHTASGHAKQKALCKITALLRLSVL
jgi:hypothetical protein